MSLSVFSRIFMKKYLAVSAALAGFLSLFAVPSHAGISLGETEWYWLRRRRKLPF